MKSGLNRWGKTLAAVWCLFLCTFAWAAPQTYQLYLDTDQSNGTGCSVSLADQSGSRLVTGFEYRLTVTADDSGQIGAATLATCTGGIFGSDSPTGTTAANIDTSAAPGGALVDRLQFSVPLAAIGSPSSFRTVLASSGDYLAQVSSSGLAPIVFANANVTGVPALGQSWLYLLPFLLGGMAWRWGRPRYNGHLVAALTLSAIILAGAGLSWAGSFAIQWQLVAPDAEGDQVPGSPDIKTLSLATSGSQLIVQIAAQGNNHAPAFSTAARDASAIVNQAWQTQIAAADPDHDAITWQISGAPAGLSISNSGLISGTPQVTGLFTITVRVTDTHSVYTEQSFRLNVSGSNGGGSASGGGALPPVFSSTPSSSAVIGQQWQYSMVASDPAGGAVSYLLTQAPTGMTLGGNVLSWTPVAAGSYAVTAVAVTTQGLQTAQTWTVNVSEDHPVSFADPALPVFLTQPSALNLNVGKPWRYAVRAQDKDGQPVTVALNTVVNGLSLNGAVPSQAVDWTPTVAGNYLVTLTARDSANRTQTQSFVLGVADDRALPADPVSRATPLMAGGITPFGESVAFLYTGNDPIQTGVATGTINEVRAAVVRGKVINRAGEPIPGVAITIHGHPEFGQTLTRADGWFDMVVNGGGLLTIDYVKPGYLNVQRRINVPWRDYAIADDVVMISLSPRATTIDFTRNALQVGQGDIESDGRGPRRATVIFPAGTTANLKMSDGSTQPLASMSFRATEYTVGDSGPNTMPGDLPLSVSYTYAVELSSDEAIAAGARSVEFSKPAKLYVENIINMAVGTSVPLGWYDHTRSAWIGEDNGRVVKVLSVSNGRAVLQVTADARPATESELAAIGIDDDELQALAKLYSTGQSLWRASIRHMTPWDTNWPNGPPGGAGGPGGGSSSGSGSGSGSGSSSSGGCDDPKACPCPGTGCEIHYLERAVGESIKLPGTPFSLNYRSDQTEFETPSGGRAVLNVQLTPPTLPPNVKGAMAWFTVEGKRQEVRHQSLIPSQFERFEWDGKDVYGRMKPRGATALAKARATLLYKPVYYPVSADFKRSFDEVNAREEASGSSVSFSIVDGDIGISGPEIQRYLKTASIPEVIGNVGQWAVDGIKFYDAEHGEVFSAGRIVKTEQLAQAFISKVRLLSGNRVGAIVPAPDGTWFVSVPADHAIYKADIKQRTVSLVAGTTYQDGFAGDDGPAELSRLNAPTAMTLAADGSLYFLDTGNHRLRRIKPDGVIETVAGNGNPFDPSNSVGPSLNVTVDGVALSSSPDGTIFIAGTDRRLRQLSASGRISSLGIEDVGSLAWNPSGGLLAATSNAIVEVGASGVTRKLAGGGYNTGSSAALEAKISPCGLAPMKGGVLFCDLINHNLRFLSADGWVSTRRGNDPEWSWGYTEKMAIGLDGDLWLTRSNDLGTLSSGLPTYGETYRVPAQDGLTLDEFDRYGKQTKTISSLTGVTLRTLSYDSKGYVSSAADAYGSLVTFERESSGRLKAVVGVNGERSELSYNGGDLAEVLTPGGVSHHLTYYTESWKQHLLKSYQDPNGFVDTFYYDDDRHLTQNVTPDSGGQVLSVLADGTLQAQSAEGRIKKFKQSTGGWGVPNIITTATDGTQTRTEGSTSEGWYSNVAANGRRTFTSELPDPRFGAASPTSYIRTEFNDSKGRAIALETKRTVELGDASDPLSVTDWSETTWHVDLRGNSDRPLQTKRYDQSAGTLSVINAAGIRTVAQVNSLLQPLVVSSDGGALAPVGYSYDERGRVKQILATSGSDRRSVAYAYHPDGVNGAGRLASIQDSLGRTTRYDYNSAGDMIQQQMPDGRKVSYEYDNMGQLKLLRTPAGVEHRFDYSPVGNLDGYTAPQGVTFWAYDRDRLLTRITRPGNQAINFERAQNGRVDRITSGFEVDTKIDYDTSGRATKFAGKDATLNMDFDGALPTGQRWGGSIAGSINAEFDDDLKDLLGPSRVSIAVPGETRTIQLAYDVANRLMRINGLMIAYDDQGGGGIAGSRLLNTSTNYRFSALGELSGLSTVMKSGFVSPEMAAMKDAAAALISILETQIVAEISRQNTCHIYGDPNDNYANLPAEGANPCIILVREMIASIRDNSASSIPYALSELQSLQSTASEGAVGFKADCYGRYSNQSLAPGGDADKRRWAQKVGNPRKSDVQFACDALVDSSSFITTDTLTGFTELANLLAAIDAYTPYLSTAYKQTFVRDEIGRIKHQEEVLLGGLPRNSTYTYTDAGQLETVTADGETTTWVYDTNGNRTSENGVIIASYDNEDRLTRWKLNTYTYNLAGDLQTKTTPDGLTQYVYDALGNLKHVTLPGKTIDYLVDPANRRIGKKVGGVLAKAWLYQGQLSPIAELKADGSIRALFLYGEKANVPAAMEMEGKTYRLISDHLGSVRAVIDADTGEVKQQMDYDTWGRVTYDSNPGFQPFGFAGGLYDADTGLTRFGARDYDAETGRWTAKDPILFKGGDTSLYGYVGGNPLSYSDPTGLCPFCVPLAIFMAEYGAELAIGAEVAAMLATGTPSPTSNAASFSGRAAQELTHEVYLGLKEGQATYVGITNNLARRTCEHGERFDSLLKLTNTPVTRDQARSIEQLIKVQNPQFVNEINSIAPERPWYNEALSWAQDWAQRWSR